MGRKYTAQERESQISQLCEGTIYSFAGWVDEYRNWTSKFVCLCEQDGEWTPSVNAFVDKRSRCPQCAQKRIADARTISDTKIAERIISQCDSIGYKFVGFNKIGKGVRQIVSIICDNHHLYTTTPHNFETSKCPICAKNQTISQFERESQIKNLCVNNDYEFIGWCEDYVNQYSKFEISCPQHGKWVTRCADFVNKGTRCPGCAKTGFDQTKPATLYAIRSDCGQYVKIGITNNFKQRFQKLKRVTPFDVSVIERIECDGQTARQFEKMFHDKFESAGFTGFDGATEWLQWSTELQYWLRLLK